MNESKTDGASTMDKIPMLSWDITKGSNYVKWFELLVKEITRIFGSIVGNAMTEGTVPKFKLEKAPQGSSKAMKKYVKDKNEEIQKQEIAFHKDCDKAVATIMTKISEDSTTRMKGHANFKQIRNRDGRYNMVLFMCLVRATHQLPNNHLIRQSKRDELLTMTQGDVETIMNFLERVITTAKIAYPDGDFNQANHISTFIKNTNSTFKQLPTEEIFHKTIFEFLEKIDDDSMPEQDRTLFKLISVVEDTAIKYNTLNSNMNRSPAAFKSEVNSEGTVMVASQNNNGKSSSKDNGAKNSCCTFCNGLPEDYPGNINSKNHTIEKCFRYNSYLEMLEQSRNAGMKGGTRENRPAQARNTNEREENNQNRKRNRNAKKNNNNNKRRQIGEGSKNAATPAATTNGKVFTTNAEYAQDDEEIGQGWITTEDHIVLSAQSESRQLNDEVAIVADSACDMNMFNNRRMFIGELQKRKRPIRMRGIGNGSVIATHEGDTVFGKALYTPEIPYSLLSHPQMVREGAIDSTRIKYHAAKVQGDLDSYSYPDIYGNMREFAPIPDIPAISKLYQHVYRLGELN